MISTRTVCIAFAIDGISNKVIGVYDNEKFARKRVKELRNVGLLKGRCISYCNEVVWGEAP